MNRWNKAMAWIMGGTAGVVLLVWAASCASPASSKPVPRFGDTPRTTVVAAPSTFRAPPTLDQAPPPQADPPGASPAPVTVGDGVHEVGADMPAGKYKTPGPNPGDAYPNCYYARLKDDSGEFRSIIANDNTKGPASVTVKSGEFFKSQGCADWAKQAR